MSAKGTSSKRKAVPGRRPAAARPGPPDSKAGKLERLARLATFLEFNPGSVIETDASGHILYLNRAARRLFKGIAAAGPEHPWLAGFKKDASSLRRSARKAVTREMQIAGRWYLRTIWSIPGDPCFRIYGRDITEHKAAEEALRESERKYRDLVDNANSIIIRWKPTGEIAYLNRFAQRFFGYSEKEIMRRSITILVPERDSTGTDLTRLVDRILADPGAFTSFENENVLRDGRRVWVRWTNRVLVDGSGTVQEVLAIGNDVTARRKAEESLREAKDYLDNLFDYANAPIIVWDAAFRITRFNHAFEELTGRRAADVIGREIDLLFPRDRREESLRQIARTISAGERWQAVEIPILHKGGAVRTVLWNSASILDPAGATIVATIAQGQDITERKRAEDELRKSQAELEQRVRDRTAELGRSTELLERMFASVDLAIAYLNKDFKFIRVNRAFADAFGGKPESYHGHDYFGLFPDAAKEAAFREVQATSAPHVEYESPFAHARGSRQAPSYWDWSLQPVASGPAPEGFILSLVDVSQRVRAEEERQRLSTAVGQSSEAIAIVDAADRIIYANRAFQTLHGLSQPDLLGRKYGDILGFDREDASFRQGIRETKNKGEVWKGRLTRAIGERADLKLDVTISPIRETSGEIVNFAILERDVTHEHRLEAYVRQLQKIEALGTLAGGIAHDLNNILVPIFINAELAAFDVEKDSSMSRYLDMILEAANRGRELVRQIIAFSRPMDKKREVVDIVPVVRESVRFLQSSIPKSVTIRERIDAAASLVRADPTQIHQVLMNLGSNAAYAMRDNGGWMDITLSEVVLGPEAEVRDPDLRPGSYVKLTVEDSGTGMTPEVQERIFDPFFTTKKQGEGTGMGLPVVRGIVKGHGGAIMVSSEPGRGSTFEVYLPVTRGLARETSSEPAPVLQGMGRVLFVDDEDMLVRTVPAMLERLGYAVTATADPVEALTLFRKSPADFNLVITDQTMPAMTGEKLAREILAIRPGIPIILCTGFSETVREDRIRALGIRDFIMKPFSTGEIAEKIQAALKRS
jgi:PAS domain S-box-containing protein